MYRLVLHRRAARYFKRQPQEQKARLKKRLDQLREAPDSAPGSKAMHGEWHGYRRLRVGILRIVYWVDRDEKVIYIDLIAPRGDVYK